MLVEKLQTVDGFVVLDLEGAPFSTGVVRSAPKLLIDGATWLARSQTYQLASFEVRGGGASAGVNAAPDQRAAAVASFVEEIGPWVRDRRFLPQPGKGVAADDLAPLRELDPRADDDWSRLSALAAVGVVSGIDHALGGIEGRAVAIEGFDDVAAQVVAEVSSRGGRIVAVGTAAGTAADPSGLPADALRQGWDALGPDLVRELTTEPGPPAAVLGAPADVLVCGSRAGVIDHGVAAGCSARAVVPAGAIPVTAKGLAVLRRAGVVVLPDFVTTAGPLLGALLPALDGRSAPARDEIASAITAVLSEVASHEQGPLLGACHRAEAFLRSWREDLPFGRPLA